MKYNFLAITCLAISLTGMTSCSFNQQNPKETKDVLVLSEMRMALTDTAFFQSTKVIPLETNDNSLIKDINEICLSNDTLFILDSRSKVIIFDTKGHYVNKIHNIGNGPQEYIQIIDICVNPLRKYIAVLCDRPYKIMYYTYSGEFIEEMTYSELYREFAIQGDTLYCHNAGVVGERKFGIFTYPMTQERGINLETGLFFDAESDGSVYRFSRGKRMTVSNDVTFTWPYDYSIYSIKNGEIYEKYRVDFKERRMPESLLNQKLRPLDFLDLCEEKRYLLTIENVVENSNYLLFGTNKDMFVYDKSNNKMTGYAFIENTALQAGSGDYLPVNHPNFIAQLWGADNFKQQIDNRKVKEGNLEKVDMSYLQVYETIKEEDNPILVLYELPH